MKKISQIVLSGMFVFLILGAGSAIMAQENADAVEQIPAQALDSSTPALLPDSPFYFLKEWTRRIRSAFTFNKTQKAELENIFANEKLLELRKMAENGAASDKIQKATENYQKAVERVKNAADKINDTAENNSGVNNFLEKFTKQQILHERILEKLETQVPEQALEKIKQAREQHVERFGQIMQKLENRPEKIKEKLETAVQNSEGEVTEILDMLKEKMPEDIKQKINEVKEGVSEKKVEANCKNLWWFDTNSEQCGQKKFCGAYMYQSLETFETNDECSKALMQRESAGGGNSLSPENSNKGGGR